MATKFTIVILAALTVIAACEEREKRQSGMPDFSEYFNQFQEQMKPIIGQFPSPPNGFGSFPSLPSFGGSSGSSGSSSPQYKRQIDQNTMSEWFNKFQEAGNNFLKPDFSQFPFPGSSSGSGGSSGNQHS